MLQELRADKLDGMHGRTGKCRSALTRRCLGPRSRRAHQTHTLGQCPRIAQDHHLATVTGKITREDCLLDWKFSARDLECLIRSLQPRPSAFAALPLTSGEFVPIKIHSAIVDRRAKGIPGTIIRSDSRGILVACGQGGLLLGVIQPEGKGRMSSAAFARGYDLKLHTQV